MVLAPSRSHRGPVEDGEGHLVFLWNGFLCFCYQEKRCRLASEFRIIARDRQAKTWTFILQELFIVQVLLHITAVRYINHQHTFEFGEQLSDL